MTSVSSNISSNIAKEVQAYSLKKAVQKDLLAEMPRPLGVVNKMNKLSGEVPNIVINALGTGLVAPFFIKYNPLSKTDEDTRTYSAMRQPVSAVLAVLTQAGLVIPFDMLIANMSNQGYFSDYAKNKYGILDKSALEKEIKKANPGIAKEELAKKVKEKELDQLTKLVTDLKQSGTIKVMKDGKVIDMPAEDLRKLMDKTASGLIKNSNASIERYRGSQLKGKIARAQYLRANHKDVNALMQELQSKASSSSHKEFSSFVNGKIKQLKSEKASAELIEILTEIAHKPNLETALEQTKKVVAKANDAIKFKSEEKLAEDVMKRIYQKIDNTKAEKAVLEEIKALLAAPGEENISKAMQKANNLKSTNFSIEVIEKHMSNVANNLKGYKAQTGLLLSLAMLPFTCTLLNYVYPKFMDKFFPELSSKKKPKHQDTFVKSAGVTPPAQNGVVADKKEQV